MTGPCRPDLSGVSPIAIFTMFRRFSTAATIAILIAAINVNARTCDAQVPPHPSGAVGGRGGYVPPAGSPVGVGAPGTPSNSGAPSSFSLDNAPAGIAPNYGPNQTAPSALGRLNPANWKMPQFKMPSMGRILPGQQEKDRIIEKKDGLFGEVSNTAKASWKRTTEALNPMKMFTAGNRTSQKTEQKPGFFKRLFTPPQTNSTPATVTEFLKQDRIQP